MIGNISNIINSLSRLNESGKRTSGKKYKCKRCSSISEGAILDGVTEICPVCNCELDLANDSIQSTSSVVAVKESSSLTDSESDELQEEVEELKDTLKEYKKLVLEGKYRKAKKLIESEDADIIIDSEYVNEDGNVEEEGVSIQRDITLDNGDEITLKVTDEDDDDDDTEESDLVAEYTRRRRNRRVRVSESLEDSKGNIETLIDAKFRDFGFAVVDTHVTDASDELVFVDITLNSSETNTKAYVEDIAEELISEINAKIDFNVSSVTDNYITITFKVYLNRPVAETADLVHEVPEELKDEDTAVDEIITEYEDALKDEVEEVLESHRKRLRNLVIRESVAQGDPQQLSDKDSIIDECDDIKDELGKVVESVRRKFRKKLKEDKAGQEIIEQSADDLVNEVDELVESYAKKLYRKRNRLVESETLNSIEDVLDSDEELIKELQEDIEDKIEDSIEDSKSQVLESRVRKTKSRRR